MSASRKLDVSRVGIIGAGASGLAAIRYLLSEKKFSKIQAYEQRASAGGVWNYTPLCKEDNFSVPQEYPSHTPDEAISVDNRTKFDFVSPVYDQLETNIPHTLMNFSDLKFPPGTALFPRHEIVAAYLQRYAEDLKPYIRYQTQVLDVRRRLGVWEVEALDLLTNEIFRDQFEAVIVASGHFTDPFVPNIPGIFEFNRVYPDTIIHSKFYRRPDVYADKKVVIVGNSASGIDLSAQISRVAKLPVIISEKEKHENGQIKISVNTSAAIYVPEIKQFISHGRVVEFANGHIEAEVDAVIFCTGFFYSYPFLQNLQPPVVDPRGGYVKHLWENIFYSADPTLAFLSIPQRGIPFPLVELQSSVISRIWSGRIDAPTRDEMESWVIENHRRKGEGKAIHLISFPEDVEYMERLYGMSEKASKEPNLGLENGGSGKRPPRWSKQEIWLRGKVGDLKQASRTIQGGGHKITSAEELGFSYEAQESSSE